jgi:hypothetical protein
MLSLLFILVFPNAGAQSQNPVKSLLLAQNQPTGEVDFKVANQEAVEKLHQMTAEEIEALDKKLAEALILYYDRKFARALPIFKEIAGQVETTDLMFWIGTSAMQVGETQLAVEKFKKMLAIDPHLYRARLELATTYFSTGRYEDARRELEIVQAASPPPGVQKNIAKLLEAIEERTKKLFYNLRASLGYMWDDNITSGPEQRSYVVSGGIFTPSATASKLADEALVTNVSGNVLYDMGESKGMMWNTAASFYNKAYSDYSQFNYMALDVTTGPWWAGTRDILKIPFGYFYSDYESERLSEAFHLDPNYEYHLNPNFSLKGLYSYTNENYFADYREGLDNTNHRFELTPNVYLKNRKHTISATAGYENHNAKSGQYSYADPYLGFSYFLRCTPDTEIFLRYQYFRREFEEIPTLYNQFRTDKRHMYTAVISQGFRKYFFASFEFGYLDNNSNLALYDYDKTTYTVSIGCRF